LQIRENVRLAPLTTLRVGGPARYFASATTEEEVREAVSWARQRKLPLFVLGGGSNLVVADSGFPGLVVHVALRGITATDGHLFAAAAGENWDAFVAHAVAQNCGGVECLSGIPGNVGGTPVQNVGAYGQEVAETITQVRVLDLERDEIHELNSSDCRFAYRASIFNSSAVGRYIVFSVEFALSPNAAPRLVYADLKKYFAGKTAPGLADAREAVRAIRRSKAMLLVEGDPDCQSAGSFFKNPIVTEQQYAELSSRPAARGKTIPRFTAPNGQLKISAAWLVENAGFTKGFSRGRVGISSKHALAIVNRGGATAADVAAFKDEIQERVEEAFGIRLQPEPVFVGF
jgi:UDP-N-acetylmuramate dehydrogenase